MNDPCGLFELDGVHHVFWQHAPKSVPPNKETNRVGWGHAAGNLSHWICLPPALLPGRANASDETNSTPYDAAGIFTGSTTVVGGVPIASYPGMPTKAKCLARPADLRDRTLSTWVKDASNPQRWPPASSPPTLGPLGCTAAWQTPQPLTQNGTTHRWMAMIESKNRSNSASGSLVNQLYSSADGVTHWSYSGALDCELCRRCAEGCSDLFPAPSSLPAGAGGARSNDGGERPQRFVFGVNSAGCGLACGGLLPGVLNGAVFTPDRRPSRGAQPQDEMALEYFGLDYATCHKANSCGGPLYAKGYTFLTGNATSGVPRQHRRIIFAWLREIDQPQAARAARGWQGAQTVPRELFLDTEADDPARFRVLPVAELAALRAPMPLARLRSRALGVAAAPLDTGASCRHCDIVVTFRGLAQAYRWVMAGSTAGSSPQLELGVQVLGVGHDGMTSRWLSGAPDGSGAHWWTGNFSLAGQRGGPLALRTSADALEMRVLLDGSIVEAFAAAGYAAVFEKSFAIGARRLAHARMHARAHARTHSVLCPLPSLADSIGNLGSRARSTWRVYSHVPAEAARVRVFAMLRGALSGKCSAPPTIRVDVDVWKMNSAWVDTLPHSVLHS
eukprot:COSAG01_NODE_531_length_15849_cov_29.199556_7_plen_617_part_00